MVAWYVLSITTLGMSFFSLVGGWAIVFLCALLCLILFVFQAVGSKPLVVYSLPLPGWGVSGLDYPLRDHMDAVAVGYTFSYFLHSILITVY